MTPLYRFALGFAPGLFKFLYRYRVLHREDIPEGQRAIICSNHITMKDPILLAFTQKRQIYFMAKAELFKNKLLGFLIRKLGAFPVTRGRGDATAVNTALEHLKQNHLLGVFIEGTRSKDGNLLRPKPGVVMFAYQTHSPIVPCAIGARDGKIRLFRRTVICYGKPIQPEELNITEGTSLEFRNASRFVMSRISDLRDEALAELDRLENRKK